MEISMGPWSRHTLKRDHPWALELEWDSCYGDSTESWITLRFATPQELLYLLRPIVKDLEEASFGNGRAKQ